MYPQGGSTIGNLLRAIQEEKAKSPLTNAPATEPGSPIRGLIQQPILQAESPDSNRNAVIRPELSTSQEIPGGSRPFDSIPPAQPEANVIAPAPSSPVIDAVPTNRAPLPEVRSSGQPSRPSNSAPSLPSLATKLSPISLSLPKVGTVLGTTNKSTVSTQPKKQDIPKPTPTPQRPKQSAPQPSRVGQFIVDASKFIQGLGTKIFGGPKTLAKK